MPKEVISTKDAPQAIGPYSQAILCNDVLYLSGQIGMDPKTTELVSDDVLEQTEQALKNLTAVLKAAGCTHENVVKTTVLLKNMSDFANVNKIYEKYFPGSTPPARACFAVADLPKGAKFEIEGIAIPTATESASPEKKRTRSSKM
eukprot:GFYU01019099.1.p1 GENE.GFYU01019099.1~~GFYU01019099.1.p1  ORF type:complete len:157 (-),score=57.89 GFYU01019099.1:104-541(-)